MDKKALYNVFWIVYNRLYKLFSIQILILVNNFCTQIFLRNFEGFLSQSEGKKLKIIEIKLAMA